jgi:predicted dehydrogenase
MKKCARSAGNECERQLIADGVIGEVGSDTIAFYITPDFSRHVTRDDGISTDLWAKNVREEALEPPALEFATVIRSGASSELDGASNLWSFGAVMAGMESSRNGRTVDVADMIDLA